MVHLLCEPLPCCKSGFLLPGVFFLSFQKAVGIALLGLEQAQVRCQSVQVPEALADPDLLLSSTAQTAGTSNGRAHRKKIVSKRHNFLDTKVQ